MLGVVNLPWGMKASFPARAVRSWTGREVGMNTSPGGIYSLASFGGLVLYHTPALLNRIAFDS